MEINLLQNPQLTYEWKVKIVNNNGKTGGIMIGVNSMKNY